MKLFFIFFFFLTTLMGAPKPLDKVSLQLVWLDQFQFAGYYMAKHKGYYAQAGLDVSLKKFSYGLDTPSEVLSGRAEFGVGRSSLVELFSHGEKIVLLSTVLQSSPSVLISLKSSNIKSVKDFKGKKLMLTQDAVDTASVRAMIKLHGIEMNAVTIKEHTFNLEDLIEKKVDIYSGYSSNEPYLLSQRGIAFNVFSPKEDGFDFYSDMLFTTQTQLKRHPQRVENFRTASLRGWEYAFSHIDETVEFIYNNYNAQHKTKEALRYEAKVLKKLAYSQGGTFGEIDKNKIQRIHDVYRLLGRVNGKVNLDKLVYDQHISLFTLQEREYLNEKKEIKICVQPNWLPYSAIENGLLIGVAASIIDKVEQIIKTPFVLVPTKTWEESLQNLKDKKCDLVPIAEDVPNQREYLRFTAPYYEEPLGIITKSTQDYILDFKSVLSHEFAIVKENSFVQKLIEKYPHLKLHYVASPEEGMQGVRENKYYGYIDIFMSCSYALKYKSQNDLIIAGQLYDKVKLSFAVRNDDANLFNIFEKVAQHLPHSTVEKFMNEWVSINYTKKTDYTYLKELLVLFFIIVSVFLYRGHILSSKNKEFEKLQDELVTLNGSLESKIKEAVMDLEKSQEMANMGSWVLDLREENLRWSKQTYKIFEVDTNITQNLYEIFEAKIHPQDKESLLCRFTKSLEEKQEYSLEHRLLMQDGSIKYVRESCETVFSEEGTPLISYGTVQDISDSVLIRQELEKKDAYMFHQSRLAQMGEMLSMIAHQWRQPLNAISLAQISITVALELEKYDLSDEKERELFLEFLSLKIEKVGQYVQNLSETIADFSDFYKPNKTSISTTVDSTILKGYSIINESIKANHIDVVLDLNSARSIKLHENEFMQVIINILNNAREHFSQSNCKNPYIIIKSFDTQD